MTKYIHLRQLVVQHFDLRELQDLCFDLSITFENLEGTTRNDKVRALIEYGERHNRIADIVATCERARPFLAWRNPSRPLDKSGGSQRPNNLPPPSYSQFIMREAAFKDVFECLEGRNSAVLIVGMGGMGKTSLARETAGLCLVDPSRAPQYDAAIWVSDEANPGTTTLDTIFDEIARTLDYPGLTQLNSAEKQNRIKKLLREQQVLIVVDNFETVKDPNVTEWIVKYLPEPSKALITSRKLDRSLWRTCPVELQGMEGTEAREFIKQQSSLLKMENLTDAQSKILIDTTGGNPFAIELIISYLQRRNAPFAQTLDYLYTLGNELFDHLFTTAWESLDEHAQEILMLITLFPDSVSKEALLRVSESEQRQFSFDRCLDNLLDLSLIKKIGPIDLIRYSIHPLVRTFATEKLMANSIFNEDARKRWLEWITSFLANVEWPWNDLGKLNDLRAEEAIGYAAIKWAATNQLHPQVIKLAKGLDHYYYVRGHWDKKAEIDQLRIEAARAIGDLAEEAISLSQYAQMLSTRGRQSDLQLVRDIYLPRLSILESTQDLPPNTIASIRHADAFYHHALGDYETAAKILKEHQTEVQLAEVKYGIANRHWLARCLYKLGDLSEAEKQFEQALQEAQAHKYVRSIAFSKRNLAEIALAQGDIVRSENLIADAFSIANEINDRRYLAKCQLVYARLFVTQGKFELAKQAYQAAEDGFNRLNLHTDMEERKTIQAILSERKQ